MPGRSLTLTLTVRSKLLRFPWSHGLIFSLLITASRPPTTLYTNLKANELMVSTTVCSEGHTVDARNQATEIMRLNLEGLPVPG